MWYRWLGTWVLLGIAPAHATNVIVVVADDVGFDKLALTLDAAEVASARYLPDTPTLDELGAAGVTFSRAWSNPVCSPTRAGFLTGNYAFHHGLGQVYAGTGVPELNPADTTIAEAFSDAGYATAAFGRWPLGNTGVGGETVWETTRSCPAVTVVPDDPNPVLHGFSTYHGGVTGHGELYTRWVRSVSEGGGETSLCNETDHQDEAFFAAALDWIGTQYDTSTDSMAPYFAFIAPKAAHFDGDGVPDSYDENDLPPSCPASDPCITDGVRDNCGDMDGDGVDDEQLVLFQNHVQCIDQELETLLLGVDALGPSALDDTIVVFFGDNGTSPDVIEDPFLQSTSWGKGSMFETGIRVPLVVADARTWQEVHDGGSATSSIIRRPGRMVLKPVLVNDLFDTLLEVAGVSTTVSTDGESFAACFTNTTTSCGFTSTRSVYSEVFREVGGALREGNIALRRGAFKLIAELDSSGCLEPTLYQLSSDPYETTDIYTTAVGAARTIKRDVANLGVSWIPLTGTGAVSWCR